MNETRDVFSTGEVARRLGIKRWRLLHLLDRSLLPEPSYRLPGRRLFTESDVRRVESAYRRHVANQQAGRKGDATYA